MPKEIKVFGVACYINTIFWYIEDVNGLLSNDPSY